ncbi:MAG: hypothetical protein ACYC6M_05055 [Terriglobales bacterium]
MPYVQAELDGIKRAQSAAGLLSLPAQHVMGGLLFLWNHCRMEKIETVSRIQLESLFAARNEPRLTDALVAFNFLEEIAPDKWRVRGLDRYDTLSDAEREARRKGGLAAKGNLRRGTAPPAGIPGSQPGSAPAEPGSASRTKARLTPAPLPEIRDPRSEIRDPKHPPTTRKRGATGPSEEEHEAAERIFAHWQEVFITPPDRGPLDSKSETILVARMRDDRFTEAQLTLVPDGARNEIRARGVSKDGFNRAAHVAIRQLYRDADSVRSFLRWTQDTRTGQEPEQSRA